MIINPIRFTKHNQSYVIRSATISDAKSLSEVRLQIDGETEYFDRVQGEHYIDEYEFKEIIERDRKSDKNLLLVAEVENEIVGFLRCIGNDLKRTSHRVEFGLGVVKEHWGIGIGKNLLQQFIKWADCNGIRKITLQVLETNKKARTLYEKEGFIVEGILRDDKLLSDGNYYQTIIMGRIRP
ncbi:GNAT family N-acetyltransferase [Bacillus weihaiensis]|uniref:GNAT family N-acetyltransferase n=1 Tax=Bacillus weihaiensis TaxID=1547283 RepID=UPI0023553E00|nr:GNAT family N-acetyltransferase [Bacillus weihaiensis]